MSVAITPTLQPDLFFFGLKKIRVYVERCADYMPSSVRPEPGPQFVLKVKQGQQSSGAGKDLSLEEFWALNNGREVVSGKLKHPKDRSAHGPRH